jgi:hypothetical protein
MINSNFFPEIPWAIPPGTIGHTGKRHISRAYRSGNIGQVTGIKITLCGLGPQDGGPGTIRIVNGLFLIGEVRFGGPDAEGNTGNGHY